MSSEIPASVDRMPRKPRAGPLLNPDEAIAWSLNSLDYKWWRSRKSDPMLSETSVPVRTILDGLRLSGYKIVPMEREDYERS